MHLPDKMLLVDVAPRDGLQSLPKWIDTDTKVWLSNRLTQLGVPVVEVASFAHPKVVPNMKDAEDVFARITRKPGVVYRGQAPNVRGAHRAIEAKVGEMLGLITVSETYTLHNQNMTNDECVQQNIQMFRLAEQNNIPFVAAVGMAFWCPYEGLIPEETGRGHRGPLLPRRHQAPVPRGLARHGGSGAREPSLQAPLREIPRHRAGLPHPQPVGHGHGQHPRRDGRGLPLARGRHLRHRRRHGDSVHGRLVRQFSARGPGYDAGGDAA